MSIFATSSNIELIEATIELAEYLGESPIATGINIGNSFYTVAEGWKNLFGSRLPNAAEVSNYYRNEKSYLYNLVFSNYGIPSQIALRKLAKDVVPKGVSVLDLGAGIGSTLLELPNTQRTHADLGGEMTKYAKYRYGKQPETEYSSVNMLELPNDYLDTFTEICSSKFDAVICTEVIEHALEPEKIVAFLADIMKPNGILIATVSFDDDDGHFPMHLNIGKYTNEDFVNKVFLKYGFKLTQENCYKRL